MKQADKIGIWATSGNMTIEDCLFFRKAKCGTCGKEWECDTTMNQWKRRSPHGEFIHYCSYSCFRKWEKPFLKKNERQIKKDLWAAEHLYDANGNRIDTKKPGRPKKEAMK